MQKNNVKTATSLIIKKYWPGILPSNLKKNDSHIEKTIKTTSTINKTAILIQAKRFINFLK
jgi:hypothetical protein